MTTRLISHAARRSTTNTLGRPSAQDRSTRPGWPGPDILVLSLLIFIAVVCAALGGLGLAAI
jgi:hypothetical protein